MRRVGLLVLVLLAGCSSRDASPAGEPPDLPPLPPAAAPRELFNASIAYATAPQPNGEASIDVSPNGTRLVVRFLQRETAAGASLLVADPNNAPARLVLVDPQGRPWELPLISVIDLNPGPTPPWYAGTDERRAPVPGAWTASLVGLGHNVLVDLVVTLRYD